MIISTKKPPDFLSFAQILISGLGLIVMLSAAGGLLFLGIAVALINGFSSDLLPVLNFSLAAGLVCALLVPSIYHTLRSMSGIENSSFVVRTPNRKLIITLLVIWPLMVLLGGFLIRNRGLLQLGIPILNILVVSIPLFVLVLVGRRGLTPGNTQRDWSIISFGLVITLPVVMIIEVFLITLLVILGLIILSTQPDVMENLNRSLQRLANSDMNPEVIERVIRPYLQKPTVIFSTLAVGAGLVPVIEELLKPLALWFIIRRLKSPVDGFSLGLLCGATFALIESLGIMATITSDSWSVIAIARIGTGLLHIVTTALVGWGLVSAWGKERFFRLGVIFVLAVILHSTWNIFGLLVGLVPLINPWGVAQRLGEIAPFALAVLMSTMFCILLGSSHRLQLSRFENEFHHKD